MNTETFKCKCGCGGNYIDRHFLERIEAAETICGFAWIVRSGYRCANHDKAVGGKGNHTTGLAVDVVTYTAWHRWKIIDAAGKVGFKRIGVGRDFLHIDMMDDRPQEVMWDYY